MTLKKKRKVLFHIGIEFLLLNSLILSVFLFKFSFEVGLGDLIQIAKLLFVFNLVWGFVILLNTNQDFYLESASKNNFRNSVINTFLFIGIISSLAIIFKLDFFNRTVLLLPIVLFGFLNFVIFNLLFEYYRRTTKMSSDTNLLFVGLTHSKASEKQIIRLLGHGHRVIGYLGKKNLHLKLLEHLGSFDNLEYTMETMDIDELYINANALSDKERTRVINLADYHGKRVNIMLDAPTIGTQIKAKIESGVAMFQHRDTPLNEMNNYLAKRFFDIMFSISVLIFLSPILLLIAILIRLDSKGSIIYAPMRKGEEDGLFKCYKFRTMSVCDDPLHGTKSTSKNDPRITRVGKWLRKLDLDELPQFFNVLIGNMSIVGPRPHRVNLQKDFRKSVNEYMVRSYVKPGITGWAQVNGWRGPTQTDIQKEQRIKHDLWFIENWSLWLDIKIIFLTVFSAKTRRNAF